MDVAKELFRCSCNIAIAAGDEQALDRCGETRDAGGSGRASSAEGLN